MRLETVEGIATGFGLMPLRLLLLSWDHFPKKSGPSC